MVVISVAYQPASPTGHRLFGLSKMQFLVRQINNLVSFRRQAAATNLAWTGHLTEKAL